MGSDAHDFVDCSRMTRSTRLHDRCDCGLQIERTAKVIQEALMEAAASVQDRRRRGPVTRGNVSCQTLLPALATLSCAPVTAYQYGICLMLLRCSTFYTVSCLRSIPWTGSKHLSSGSLECHGYGACSHMPRPDVIWNVRKCSLFAKILSGLSGAQDVHLIHGAGHRAIFSMTIIEC